MGHCATCGNETDEHDLHVRFLLPDPVLRMPDREATSGTWMSGPDAHRSMLMQVPDAGAFVRALLPVRLTGGYHVTYGTWVAVHPDDLQRAHATWWEPEYVDLRLAGVLANDVQPWGLLGSPVTVAIVHENQGPYCVASPEPRLAGVLDQEWDHELVRPTLPTGTGGCAHGDGGG